LDAKGYYATLGVSEQAKYYEIRAAYRRLARKYHPDVNSSLPNEEMIKKNNAAFEVLSDKEKRRQYDETDFYDDNTLQHQHKNKDIANDNENMTDDLFRQNKSDKDSSSTYRNFYSDSNNQNNSPTNDNYYYYRDAKSQTQKAPSTTTTGSLDISKSRFRIIVEPSLCMAFGSCETLAAKVFVVEKDKMLNPKAKVVSETTEEKEDFDAIFAAAETCPTKAIIIIDRNTGEQIYP
jgi:curved DNA-binding protein CbpA